MGCRMAIVRARESVQALLSAMWCKNGVVGYLSSVGMFVRVEVRKNGVSSRIRFHVQAGLLSCSGLGGAVGVKKRPPERQDIARKQSIALLQNTSQVSPSICLQVKAVSSSGCHPNIPKLTLSTAGTNPIHNKKPKKAKGEEDEDDKAFKAKQAAGTRPMRP
jgi:hypothetical protein